VKLEMKIIRELLIIYFISEMFTLCTAENKILNVTTTLTNATRNSYGKFI